MLKMTHHFHIIIKIQFNFPAQLFESRSQLLNPRSTPPLLHSNEIFNYFKFLMNFIKVYNQ
jgi:hypothetical protein